MERFFERGFCFDDLRRTGGMRSKWDGQLQWSEGERPQRLLQWTRKYLFVKFAKVKVRARLSASPPATSPRPAAAAEAPAVPAAAEAATAAKLRNVVMGRRSMAKAAAAASAAAVSATTAAEALREPTWLVLWVEGCAHAGSQWFCVVSDGIGAWTTAGSKHYKNALG